MKQYFLAIIESDMHKLNERTGKALADQMRDLKMHVDAHGGRCTYYQITDVKALEKFEAEIKRLNP